MRATSATKVVATIAAPGARRVWIFGRRPGLLWIVVLAALFGGLVALTNASVRHALRHPGSALRRPSASSRPTPMPLGDSVVFEIDASVRHPISPYIYGLNFVGDNTRPDGRIDLGSPPPFRLDRLGGNRFSAYNWETNYSNAGSDYEFSNDRFLSESQTPGEAVRSRIASEIGRGMAALVTVPMLSHVAGDDAGPLGAADSTRGARLARHFKRNRAAKPGSMALVPDTTDDEVYQDEFVHWLDVRFPGSLRGSGAPIFLSLDNEPESWPFTHREVESMYGEVSPRLLTYDGFITRTIDFASAIKRVAPTALVFGPATATWVGMATLGRYPRADPQYGTQYFLGVYLDRMREAERLSGRRVLDVLDVHWYPEVAVGGHRVTEDAAPQTDAMVLARLQSTRSLWDSSYVEGSWVSEAAGGAIRLVPRLRELIAAHYPGTRIAISEYYYGRAGDISGGVAQADALGIFGREGVFAAALWLQTSPQASPYGGSAARARAYAFGAFAAYLDYDGNGGRFGDVGLKATTSAPQHTSVYGSVDAAGRVVLIAINRTSRPLTAHLRLHRGSATEWSGQAFTLVAENPRPSRQADFRVSASAFAYRMPPLSVSTLVLTP